MLCPFNILLIRLYLPPITASKYLFPFYCASFHQRPSILSYTVHIRFNQSSISLSEEIYSGLWRSGPVCSLLAAACGIRTEACSRAMTKIPHRLERPAQLYVTTFTFTNQIGSSIHINGCFIDHSIRAGAFILFSFLPLSSHVKAMQSACLGTLQEINYTYHYYPLWWISYAIHYVHSVFAGCRLSILENIQYVFAFRVAWHTHASAWKIPSVMEFWIEARHVGLDFI